MATIRTRWDEDTLAGMLHDAALHRARKRKERERKGIDREPRTSLWELGKLHGQQVKAMTPANMKEVLAHAREMAKEEVGDSCTADALLKRNEEYYKGLVFALQGPRIKSQFAAKAAPEVRQLVAAI